MDVAVQMWEELDMPTSPQEWSTISSEWEEKWNYPHCIGAMDGKHIITQCPINSGSEYINYKGTFSVVLMALVDANYNFLYADIGCQGRISDGGVFRNTTLFKKIENNLLLLPADQPLPTKTLPMPYVIVADDAFALSTNIMKPYPGPYAKGSVERVFNYRLSRARRVVENVFGIMASTFRMLRKPILLEPEKVTSIVMACVLLHNFLRKSRTSSLRYTPLRTIDSENEGEFIPGTWRNEIDDRSSMIPLRNVARKSGLEAKKIRDEFADYFSTTDKLPWQDKYC
eukprot:XP_008180991.1 PREDICTED: uncharacterized protein LOC103308758 [Acyrthosiphon pisum]